jgi:hypothetical protein
LFERAPFTHPDIATLVTPLFAFGGKRVALAIGGSRGEFSPPD